VALARGAVEEAFHKRLQKDFPQNAVTRAKLKAIIDDYGSRIGLSKQSIDLAHKVRIAGNDVLHQQELPSNTLEVIEAARSVILELSAVRT
jgi:hypothetical protein